MLWFFFREKSDFQEKTALESRASLNFLEFYSLVSEFGCIDSNRFDTGSAGNRFRVQRHKMEHSDSSKLSVEVIKNSDKGMKILFRE